MSAKATSPDQLLWIYYQRLVVLGAVVFLLSLAFVLRIGWKQQEAVETTLAHQRVQESSHHLQAKIKAANDEVFQLAKWSETFLNRVPYSGDRQVRDAVVDALRNARDGEFNLDSLAALPATERPGQMLGLVTAARPAAGTGVSHLELAISLLDRMGDGQKTSSFLRSTYFFSAPQDLLAITPWYSSQDMLTSFTSIKTLLEHSWSDYEITKNGRPEANTERQAYWTEAYADLGGAGLMVSLGQPVYWNNQFTGVVGTDVLLSFLSEELRAFPDGGGTLLISNERGQVLAHRDPAIASGKSVTTVGEVLPRELSAHVLSGQQGGAWVGSNFLVCSQIKGSKWHIIFVLPQDLIKQRAFKSFAPQLMLAFVLMLGMGILNAMLWRNYVAPALRVASYVNRASTDATAPAPQVPGLWRGWVTDMVKVFTQRQQLVEELEVANRVLEHKVTERTRELLVANEQLVRQANTDALTGAYNRRYLFDVMETELARMMRREAPLALLMIDLDHFKRINDTYGHGAGDAVLKEFVRRAVGTVRAADRVCRFGGEEFAVFLPDCSLEGAVVLAERLLDVFANTPFEYANQHIAVTASIGVAAFRDGDDAASLLKHADEQLYHAKKQGRNRVAQDG